MALSITATFRCDHCPRHATLGLLVTSRPEDSGVLAKAEVGWQHLPQGWRCVRGRLICWACGEKRRGGSVTTAEKPALGD